MNFSRCSAAISAGWMYADICVYNWVMYALCTSSSIIKFYSMSMAEYDSMQVWAFMNMLCFRVEVLVLHQSLR